MHLEIEQIERLLHHELSDQQAANLHGHLAGCAHCRARVAEAEAEESDLMRLIATLDVAPPPATIASIRARSADRQTHLPHHHAKSRRRSPAAWRLAASLVIALGIAGVALALPGSPLRHWLGHLGRQPNAPGPTAEPPSQLLNHTAGVAVPAGDRLIIEFAAQQQAGVARVSVADGGEVVVRSIDGSANFTLGAARLLIDNHGSSSDFEMTIPRAAPRVRVMLAGRTLLLVENGRVTSQARRESNGVILLDLRAPDRGEMP